MIVAKLRPPPLAAVLIPRPRVQEALAGAAGGHRVVAGDRRRRGRQDDRGGPLPRGAPGEDGVALARSVRHGGGPVRELPGGRGRAGRSRGSRRWSRTPSRTACSRRTAPACWPSGSGPGWTIVLDDLHHLEPDAPALGPLRAFLRYLPADALAVLVSRRMPSVDLFHGLLTDQLSGVFDDELAFSLDETQALLEAREVDVDPRAVHGATGGWAAGIVFEALRRPASPSAFPTTEGPLFSYLGRRDPPRAHAPPAPRAAADRGARHGHGRAAGAAARRSGPPVMIEELGAPAPAGDRRAAGPAVPPPVPRVPGVPAAARAPRRGARGCSSPTDGCSRRRGSSRRRWTCSCRAAAARRPRRSRRARSRRCGGAATGRRC